MPDLLVEIGCEELPAGLIRAGSEELALRVGALLDEGNITCGEARSFATPRRLAVITEKVAARGRGGTERVVGPPEKAAYNDGKPTPALEGFAAKQGADVAALKVEEERGGRYVVAYVEREGADTKALLAERLPALLESIPFAYTMKWRDGAQFPRPVRWLVCLLGDEAVEFEAFGLKSGRETRGNRLDGNPVIRLATPLEYERELKAAGVVPGWEERREAVKAAVTEAARGATGGNGTVWEDKGLLDEVTGLVERDSVVVGRFDETFLELPDIVVRTAMKAHQRYFAVGEEAKLLPYFVAAVNCRHEHAEAVRPGLESVLRARLEDARFYWENDCKVGLEAHAEALKGIVWLEGLGTVADKAERVAELAVLIGKEAGVEFDEKLLRDIAKLYKADLATQMIRDGKEFTGLEGLIGANIATAAGMPEELVGGMNLASRKWAVGLVAVPARKEKRDYAGVLVRVADRVDSIVALHHSGYRASGSSDPMGIRIMTTEVVQTVISSALYLDLNVVIGEAMKSWNKAGSEGVYGSIAELQDILLARAESEFRQYGNNVVPPIRFDLVRCVIGAAETKIDLRDLFDRLLRLHAKCQPDVIEEEHLEAGGKRAMLGLGAIKAFNSIATNAKRMRNILKEAPDLPPVNPALFSEPEEKALWEAAQAAKTKVDGYLAQRDYDALLDELLALKDPIHTFFDQVFVMVDDEKLRNNRLALCAYVKALFDTFGDFSQIEV